MSQNPWTSPEPTSEDPFNHQNSEGSGQPEQAAPTASYHQAPPETPPTTAPYERPAQTYGSPAPATWYGDQPPPPQQGFYVTSPPPAPEKEKAPGGAKLIATALLAALLGGGVASAFDDNSPKVVQESITQNVTGGVNWNSTARTVANSVVTLSVEGDAGSGEGSGVVLDEGGTIVTNNHVVAAGGNSTIRVIVEDRAYRAKVVGADPTSDIAVVRLEVKPEIPLVPIKFIDSDKVQVGENVMAVGSPLGLQGTVTTGIVSALKRPVVTSQDSSSSNSDIVVTNAIQTSAPINPGNSGGALVNANGELIGINSSIATLSQAGSGQSGSIGIGFAIPSNQVKAIVEQILKTGKVDHAFLGITSRNTLVSEPSSPSMGMLGVELLTVANDSPAQKAGLKAGDVIVKFNDDVVTSQKGLVALVREAKPQEKVKLLVITSKGVKRTVEVTLGTLPPK